MAVKGILCIELSVLLLCYKLCKSQADTCTVFLGAFPAVEAFKKMGQVFFMKPFSPVRKTDFPATVPGSARRQAYAPHSF